MSTTDVPTVTEEDAAETMRERLAFYAYASASWLGRTLPTQTGRALFRLFGALAFRLASGQRAIVAANQAQVLGRPAEDPLVVASTREAFLSYGRYWYDTFALSSMEDEELHAGFDWDGEQYLLEPTSRGQGVIAVLPHLGNWDACGRDLSIRGLPIVAVAERLRPERLYQLFVREREANGVRVIGLGDAGVGKGLSTALAEGNVLALLADRDLSGRGIKVEMFGATRRMPAGPAMLALSTGAPIVAVGCYQTDVGWHAIARPLAMPQLTGERKTDARAITQRIASAFEALIAASPADWHVFQPAWSSED